MTLHEAIDAAVGNEMVPVEQVVSRIRDQGTYRQENGDLPDASQVVMRAANHAYQFEILIRRRQTQHEWRLSS